MRGRTVFMEVSYDFCLVELNTAFGLYGMFAYCWPLVSRYGVGNVFRNPCGDVATILFNAYLPTAAEDMVYTTKLKLQWLRKR